VGTFQFHPSEQPPRPASRPRGAPRRVLVPRKPPHRSWTAWHVVLFWVIGMAVLLLIGEVAWVVLTSR
jgi:hypothetical protein